MVDAIIVFAKEPEPGEVKTRLTELLTEREAARLYEAFLHDALAQYERLPVDLRLYLDGKESVTGTETYKQEGAGLGERMARAFAESFASGYERLVVIGTDHPTLPDSFIEEAFDALDEPGSVVIGPARDGGYYLLGMRDLQPGLFRKMRFSHDGVFEETLERARRLAAHLTILPEWYDVDTPADLRRLARELEESEEAGPQRSRRVLLDLMEAYPAFFARGGAGLNDSS